MGTFNFFKRASGKSPPSTTIDEAALEQGHDEDAKSQDIEPNLDTAATSGEPPETEARGGWLARLGKRVAASSQRLSDTLHSALGTHAVDTETLENLEDALLSLDFGASLTDEVMEELRTHRDRTTLDLPRVRTLLRDAIAQRLSPVASDITSVSDIQAHVQTNHAPWVVLLSGVNGAGKTTTVAKLASHYGTHGLKVMVAAADTFRAAASEQLSVWATRAGATIVAGKQGDDPTGLVWNALTQAKAEAVDVVLIDTAGRLHNRSDLMDQLRRLFRVAGSVVDHAPHEHILVLDGSSGQNALQQVALFSEVSEVTGLVVSKLDNTPRAGILVAVADRHRLPIVAIGVGEKISDVKPLNAEEFADVLVGTGDTHPPHSKRERTS